MSNWNNRFLRRFFEEIPMGFILLRKGKEGWSCDQSQGMVFPRVESRKSMKALHRGDTLLLLSLIK
jgi:hypothetical protein